MQRKKIAKTGLFLFIFICINIAMCFTVSALTEQVFITLKINGNCIKTDAEPYMKNDRTFVSVRFVAEALGAEVKWLEEEKKVIIGVGKLEVVPDPPTAEPIVQGDKTIVTAIESEPKPVEKKAEYLKTIELSIGSSELHVNGEKKLMDTAPEIFNGRTMVPLRVISENLDCAVKWDELTYSVLINKENAVVAAACIENRSYTDDDIIWLARIIDIEGGGLSINGRLGIANVVLNRKKSPRFPNTICDVIFDKAYSTQFPPAHKKGFKESIPSRDCVVSAKMALEGINNVDKCLFFNHVPFKGKNKLFKRIDGMYFYY